MRSARSESPTRTVSPDDYIRVRASAVRLSSPARRRRQRVRRSTEPGRHPIRQLTPVVPRLARATSSSPGEWTRRFCGPSKRSWTIRLRRRSVSRAAERRHRWVSCARAVGGGHTVRIGPSSSIRVRFGPTAHSVGYGVTRFRDCRFFALPSILGRGRGTGTAVQALSGRSC